jgi:hypothetical protein
MSWRACSLWGRNLTPGDFAVVARQLRHLSVKSTQDIVARLHDESRAKPGIGARLGF